MCLFYTSSISCCFVTCLLCFLTLFVYILFVVPCLDKRGRISEDEDDGRSQKRVLVEILQTVNRMDEDVKRVNEDVKRVNDVVTKMATINDNTGTPSHQGNEALQGCPLKLNLPESDSKKVFEKPLDTKTEGETLTVIFSKLRSLLPDGLSLGDSQSCKWLPQTLDGANPKNVLKSDGFVICTSFLMTYSSASGTLLQRPALNTKLFSCLRCLIEGKQTNAQSPAATGQAHMYAMKLVKYVPVLHVLLIDRFEFRAECWDHGVLVGYVDGGLTTPGSKDFLSKFLLGAGCNKGELLLPTVPSVHELEVAQRALVLLPGYTLILEKPVLGLGGTAVVLHMKTAQGAKVAVKVVRPGRSAHFLKEKEVYTSLRHFPHSSQLVEDHTSEDINVLVLTPVGEAMIFSEEMIISGISALCALHHLGFAHGDARHANLINA